MTISLQTQRKLLKIMRISLCQALMAFVFVTFANANTGLAQQALKSKISIQLENHTIIQALDELEKIAKIRFMYASDVFDPEAKTNVSFKNTSLEKILHKLLGPLHVEFEIQGNDILLIPETKPKSSTEKALSETEAMAGAPVTGTILDEKGQPIIGVTVSVKGTTSATITDVDGKFSINVPENTAEGQPVILIFSMVGYISQEVTVGSQTTFDIKLLEDVKTLEDVVVIGYGTQKKSDVIGSVTSVPQERLQNLPVTNLTQAIQGSTAGVFITQGSSLPGSTGTIRIRGVNSITATKDPFIVVDGMPFYGSFNDIPPSTIQSIEILKDASATAIYGTRGSNGVILITTKRGKTGKPTVTYNVYGAMEEIAHMLTPRGPDAYVQKYKDYMIARGLTQTAVLGNQAEIDNYNAGVTTDWMNEVSKTGFLHEHTLNVSGGTENAQYFISGNFLDQNGVIQGYHYQRENFRANLDLKVTDWMKVGIASFFSNNDYSGGRANLLFATAMSPYSKPRNADGSLIIYPMSPELLYTNPLLGTKTDRLEINKNLTGNFYTEITPGGVVKGLKYRLNGSYAYQPQRYADYTGRAANNNSGTGNSNNFETTNWTLENILSYTRDIKKHHFEVLALYSAQEKDYFENKSSGTGFVNDALSYNSLGAATTVGASTKATKETWVSQMGRLIYSYDNRYSVQLTIRRDGYSAFGSNTNKYAAFPAIGVAWNMHNESFMKDIRQISNMKVRLSYGKTGNMGIPVYGTQANASTVSYPFGGAALTGVTYSSMANPNLRWESTATLNAAVDFGLFNNRIGGTIEVYQSNTSDLLLWRQIPNLSGYTQVLDNVGKVKNTGIEISINSVNINTGGFKWETNVNFNKVKNEVVELYGDGKDDLTNRWFLGKPLNAIYDYQMDGIWQTGEDVSHTDPTAKAGDIKFKDLNGDGVIDAQHDKTYLGTNLPTWTGGLTNRFSYKDFTLSIFLQTSQGSLKVNPDISYGDEIGKRNSPAAIGYWTPDNHNNDWPSLSYFNTRGYGYPRDASYLRIQDVRLAYNVPESVLKKFKVNSLQFYVSGRNLYTFTNWIGWDPENNQFYRGSGDWTNAYPLVRSVSLGLNLSF